MRKAESRDMTCFRLLSGFVSLGFGNNPYLDLAIYGDMAIPIFTGPTVKSTSQYGDHGFINLYHNSLRNKKWNE